MIKIFLWLFIATTLFAGTNVCVSIPPQAFFVQKIAGDTVNITVLIPAGSSPATYTPKPSQLKAIKNASLYFTIGVPFEHNWLNRFKSINTSLKIIDITQGIQKRALHNPLEKENHQNHQHEALDPHVWLSPKLTLILAKNIMEALSQEHPQKRTFYKNRYNIFKTEVVQLQNKIKQKLQKLKNKTFIVFHPSFGYFADEFGLKQIAIEKEGKEPSLKYIRRVIDFAKSHNIKTIFVEPQFSQKSANYIAKQINGQVISIDPLAKEWDRNLLEIATSFEKASNY